MQLIPRETKFFDMFDRASQNVLASAYALRELVLKFDSAPETQKRILELEHEGDIITHEIMDALNKTFITPFDREDIHALATALDDIIDNIEAVGDRMVLYNIGQPRSDVAAMIEVLVTCCEQVSKAVSCLQNLPANHTRIMHHCIEIDRLENDGDRSLRQALARLFNDDQIRTVDIIKWKELYETIEAATDLCEDVSDVIESVMVKNA